MSGAKLFVNVHLSDYAVAGGRADSRHGANTVARAFIDHLVARFGVAATVRKDRGTQFEFDLFASIIRLLGISRTRTTS